MQVNVLQMHGTGTALGDPIEVNAALGGLLGKGIGDQPLALTAHKSCAGHAEPAAGLVGIAYAVLGLEALKIAALLHLRWLIQRAGKIESCHVQIAKVVICSIKGKASQIKACGSSLMQRILRSCYIPSKISYQGRFNVRVAPDSMSTASRFE